MRLLLVGDLALRAGLCRVCCTCDNCAASVDLSTSRSQARSCRSRRDAPAGRHAFDVADYSAIEPLRTWR